jgi:hypothetical protein
MMESTRTTRGADQRETGQASRFTQNSSNGPNGGPGGSAPQGTSPNRRVSWLRWLIFIIVTVAERDPCSALASGGAFPLKRSPRFARSSSSSFGARLQLDLIAQPFQQTRCCSLPLMRHPISRRPKSSSTAVPQGHHLALPVIVNRHPVRGRQASSIRGGKTDPPVNTTHQYTGWAVIQGESYSVKRRRRE